VIEVGGQRTHGLGIVVLVVAVRRFRWMPVVV
jgi:hypothetical protein